MFTVYLKLCTERLSYSFRYFHKIPPEAPELELKATYGLASAQEFAFPSPHPLWSADTYGAFDVTKAHVPQVKNL
mgnify:CR=1 FL=1